MGHGPNHRGPDGSTFGLPGGFACPASLDDVGWRTHVKKELTKIRLHEAERIRMAGEPAAMYTDRIHQIHLENLRSFFGSFSVCPISRFTCFTCLMEIPQYQISCGHFFCAQCIWQNGAYNEKGVVIVQTCPLDGKNLDTSEKFQFRLDIGRLAIPKTQKSFPTDPGTSEPRKSSRTVPEQFGGGPGGMPA